MKKKKKLVVLTGAGISAESGLATFRGADGLWEGHSVYDVASPEGWHKDKELVLEFYNQRRKQGIDAEPNPGHLTLKELEEDYEVVIITQNIDNLHEKAGSTNIIHLHGEIFKAQSTYDPSLLYDMDGWELNLGDKCEHGSQLRPFVVWFGEAVPKMGDAIDAIKDADACAIIGTSLLVYPAAGLIDYAPLEAPVFVIDPSVPNVYSAHKIHRILEPASTGILKMKEKLGKIFSKPQN